MRCVLTRTSSCFLRQPPAVYCSLLVLSALRLASILLHTPLLFSSCRRREVDRMGALSRNRRSLEYSDLILLTPPPRQAQCYIQCDTDKLRGVQLRGELISTGRTAVLNSGQLLGFRASFLTPRLSSRLFSSCRR